MLLALVLSLTLVANICPLKPYLVSQNIICFSDSTDCLADFVEDNMSGKCFRNWVAANNAIHLSRMFRLFYGFNYSYWRYGG